MPVNRTLEAMRTHKLAKRSAANRHLAQLAADDLQQAVPVPDGTGITAYSGERAIAMTFRTAEDQKLYFVTETVAAGIATLLFLAVVAAVPLYHYFHP
jgi:hypothetical protein